MTNSQQSGEVTTKWGCWNTQRRREQGKAFCFQQPCAPDPIGFYIPEKGAKPPKRQRLGLILLDIYGKNVAGALVTPPKKCSYFSRNI